jgi:methylmalonyl-CoA mutase N-terminal domain/subunit
MEEREKTPVFRIDPALERAQIESLRELKASRDAEALRLRLERLEAAARGTENLMPAILDAAEAYATVGEISDTLRRVFGEYRDAG